jgi:hypothetical protein
MHETTFRFEFSDKEPATPLAKLHRGLAMMHEGLSGLASVTSADRLDRAPSLPAGSQQPALASDQGPALSGRETVPAGQSNRAEAPERDSAQSCQVAG